MEQSVFNMDKNSANFDRKCSENNVTEEQPIYKKVLSWISRLLFFSIAVYWIYQVVSTYCAEPIMTTTSIIKNKSFSWPTISVAPALYCFNLTEADILSKEYSLTVNTTYSTYIPFDFKYSSTKPVYNLNDMVLLVKSPDRESIISDCRFYSTDYQDCMGITSDAGHWMSYNTLETPVFDFTPRSSSNAMDVIVLTIDHTLCDSYQIQIHPPTEEYYIANPTAKYFSIDPGKYLTLKLKAEEFVRVNRRSSPCVEDVRYSYTECIASKEKAYLIKQAGCYLPAITGYPTSGNYPECNNISYYIEFRYWHRFITHTHLYTNKDLENERSKCIDPCFVKMYQVTENKISTKEYGYPENDTYVKLAMSDGAMYYIKVEEHFAMTVDMLVANIGGTLGLFLGFSCFTLINALHYIINKMKEISRKLCGTDSGITVFMPATPRKN